MRNTWPGGILRVLGKVRSTDGEKGKEKLMTTSGGWKFFKNPRKTCKSKPENGLGGEFKKKQEKGLNISGPKFIRKEPMKMAEEKIVNGVNVTQLFNTIDLIKGKTGSGQI